MVGDSVRWLGIYACFKKPKRSSFWSKWSVALIVLFSGKCIYSLVYNVLTPNERVAHKYLIALEGFACLQISSCLLISLWAAPRIAGVIQTLEQVEKALADHNMAIHYRTTKISTDFAFRASVFGLITSMRLIYSHHRLTRSLELLSMAVLSLTELLNVAIISCMNQVLEHLNSNLNKKSLSTILSLEHVLIEVSNSYRSVTERRLLLRVGTTYVMSSIELFFLLTIIGVWSGPSIVYQAAVTPYNLYEVFVTICSIHSFSKKTINMRKSLYGLVLSDNSSMLAKDGKIRAHLRMNNSVQFSACGFFPIDATLIHSILASMANYLAILYQFGMDQSTASLEN